MKRMLLCFVALLLIVAVLPAKPRFAKAARAAVVGKSYPLVSIHDLQYDSPAALASCDSADAASGPASTATGVWIKQTSAYSKYQQPGGLYDTVEIVGQMLYRQNIFRSLESEVTILRYAILPRIHPVRGLPFLFVRVQ